MLNGICLMKIMRRMSLGAAAILLLILGFVYSGVFNVSALVPHSSLATWLLSTTMHASVKRRADNIELPDLRDATLQRAGINDFTAMCAGCHGAPGREPEAMGLGLNPRPPDLAVSARHMSDAELFWVTKNGIRMTGMPAWGATHDDAALWPVIAFMRLLPDLDAAAYQALADASAGTGHHASGQSTPHTHDSTEATTASHDDADPLHDHATGAADGSPPPGADTTSSEIPATIPAHDDHEH